MEVELALLIEVCAIVGGLVSGFLLSGADAAFSTLSKPILQRLKEESDNQPASLVTKWLETPERLFGTIAIGKTVMTVGFILVATTLTFQYHESLGLGIAFALVLLGGFAVGFFLLVVEWLPRSWVERHPESAVRWAAWVVLLTYWLLWPVISPILRLTRRSGRMFSSGRYPYWLDDELHRVLELEETGTLKPDDKEMISSIIELRETIVREVMVPRVDMVCADGATDLRDLLALIKEAGHSRIPVYQGSVDNIIGVVYAKDLLQHVETPGGTILASRLARPPYFIPETKKVDELLREFQREKTHLAIVVDEYGGTAGLVTLEDLLEEIVGEIQDEYDVEEPMYEQLPDGSVLVDAKLNIDALNELLELDLTTDGFETIGGLIYDLIGRVPEQGEVLEYRNLRFVVKEIEGQRISKVAITKIAPVPNTEEHTE